MNIRLKTYCTSLSDGSEVFDVAIRQDNSMILLKAVSKEDAWWLIEKLSCAIGEHALDTIESKN